MQIEVLGCYGGRAVGCRVTSLLVNGRVAVDAGSLASTLSRQRQLDIDAILLTHSHLDHIGSLPFFLENVHASRRRPVDLWAHPATLEVLRRHLFNDVVWPDFERLSGGDPPLNLRPLEEEVAVEIGGVRFLPVKVAHRVPTFGFLIEEQERGVLWSSDTGPTRRLWELANQSSALTAVWVETSFGDGQSELAARSQHLTPATLRLELAKLDRSLPVLVHHLKPSFADAVSAEIRALRDARIGFLEQGRVYEF